MKKNGSSETAVPYKLYHVYNICRGRPLGRPEKIILLQTLLFILRISSKIHYNLFKRIASDFKIFKQIKAGARR